MMNVVMLSGRLTKDPKFAPDANGDANKNRTSFHLAVTDVYAAPGPDGKQRADFVPCTAWGKNADNIAKHCGLGKAVTVKGHLRTNTVDNADGTKSYFWETVVESIEFGADAKNQKGKTKQVAAPTELLKDMTPAQLQQVKDILDAVAAKGAPARGLGDDFPSTVSA